MFFYRRCSKALIRRLYTGLFNGVATLENKEVMSDSKIDLLANLFKVFRFGSAQKDFDIELGRSVCHDGLEITISRSDLKLRLRTVVNQCS